MKYLIVLVVVCAAVSFSEQAMTKEQVMELYNKMVEECAKKESGSSTDIEEVFAKKLPSTKNGKCIHACVGETTGLIKDNKVNVEGAIAMAKMVYDNDAAKVQMANDLANDCIGVTDGERCEAAFKIIQCSEQAHKARGVSFLDLSSN
ncbi:uncharacterized protein LOC116350788 [Contarinia nasturtii]|uniref:uncharacterized protein LOC116350788 n=1 Tax=Contarinia nasturtii TaxID=265458 RepID=UPI0012D3C2AD|nr:uncharacterized protein LOC116350788 [Contarinia nasturtii]